MSHDDQRTRVRGGPDLDAAQIAGLPLRHPRSTLRWVAATIVLLVVAIIVYTLVDNQNAGSTLQAIQAAQPYAPDTAALKCNSTPAPAGVIANLKTTPLARPELDKVRVTFRVRNLTNRIYAQWSDPGYPDQILLGAPRTYEIAASARW